MIEVNSQELPKGWCWVQHKDIATINPKLPFNNVGDTTLVSFVPMSAVEAVCGKYDLSQVRKFGEVKKGYTPFIDSDLIFAKITPCMENGKIAVLENLTNGVGFGSTEFHVSRLTSLTHKKYLFYFFTQKAFRRDAQQHMTGSAGQLRVPKTYFEQIFIPLPPRSEQHRIVEKIEELFSDLDKGIESLKTTQQQLKIYRQAVLKWAFEGRLTAKWREEKKQQGELKSAEELLVQIKAEREKRDLTQLQEWHEAVKTWEANGKQGKKPGKPQRLKDLPPPSATEIDKLPELPKEWLWIRLEESSDAIDPQPSHRTPPKVQNGIPFISIQDFDKATGKINFDNARKVSSSVLQEHIERYALEDGDFIIGKIGTVGNSFKIPSKRFFAISANVVLIAVNRNIVTSDFLFYLIKSQLIKRQFDEGSKATTQSAFGIQKVRLLIVPYTSKEEQNQIIEEIEFRLSICDRLEATITENITRAEALRQSILKQAFAGKLVPQDPNDEPAEQLIERIRQEKLHGKNGKQLELEIFVDVENE
jgi:type I restriction enzyme, S subunit